MLGLQGGYYFQHENDPEHTDQITRVWIPYHFLRMPHRNHDTNPIENLWAGIDKILREHKISNKEMINQKNLEVWNSIERSFILKQLVYIPNRLSNVMRYTGGSTVCYKINTKQKICYNMRYLTKHILAICRLKSIYFCHYFINFVRISYK